MDTMRWINHSLPQSLANAVLLLYINAAFGLLLSAGFFLPVAAAQVAAGLGIANEKRWGYQLGVFVAFFPFVFRYLVGGLDGVLGVNLIGLMFDIALVALLLHTDSREHQRIWFS